MEIKSFECSYLEDVKKLLKAAFYRENSNAVLNEWEFAETVLQDAGYKPYLCLIAVEKDEVIGYNILTAAAIGEQKGLALGPLAVKKECQNKELVPGWFVKVFKERRSQAIPGSLYWAAITIPALALKPESYMVLPYQIMHLKTIIFRSFF